MRNIIVLNDRSVASVHAMKVAKSIAVKVQANILSLNVTRKKHEPVLVGKEGLAMDDNAFFYEQPPVDDVTDDVIESSTDDGFSPKTMSIDAWEYTEADLTQLIIRNHTWMMLQGVNYNNTLVPPVNGRALLNRVQCPLLLVPENTSVNGFERLIYTADLRYCRLAVVRFLAQLAQPYKAALMIAHLSADGLPHMQDDYAYAVFNSEICNNVRYDKMIFNNIKERNLGQVVDVLVNGMHADMLAMVNHNFHYEKILGNTINQNRMAHLNVPVLLFPY